jgi:hypothetical protein
VNEQVTVVDSPDTWEVWRQPEWGHPGGFRTERKSVRWEWGPNSDGTWFARPRCMRDGGLGNGETLATARDAQWYAEYCDRTPGAHSNWALYSLHQERLKWTRAEHAAHQP